MVETGNFLLDQQVLQILLDLRFQLGKRRHAHGAFGFHIEDGENAVAFHRGFGEFALAERVHGVIHHGCAFFQIFQRGESGADAAVGTAWRVDGVLTGHIGEAAAASEIGYGFLGVIAVVEDDFTKFNFLRATIAVGDFLIGLLHLGVGYWVGAQDVCHQSLGGYVTFKGFPVLLEGGFASFELSQSSSCLPRAVIFPSFKTIISSAFFIVESL